MIEAVKIKEICTMYSAGDKPKNFSEIPTKECSVPVYGNGSDNYGLVGYTDKPKIMVEAITIAARGSSCGATFFREKPYTPIVRLISAIPNEKIYAKYLYYVLLHRNFKGSGSGQPQITIPDIENEIVYIETDLDKQKRIAEVLYAIEKKVENNIAICESVENIAKTLYEYWFVQFDYPNNSKPYRSSGGKMVWNDVINREIPVGWKVAELGSVLSLLRDGTHNPPKRVTSGVPLLTGTMFGKLFLNYSQATYVTEEDYERIHASYKPEVSDIVLTKIGTLGNVNYLCKEDLPITVHCNSALLRFPENMQGMFTIMYCRSDEFQKRLRAVKGQSVQEFCGLDSISSVLMIVPDEEIIKKYNEKTNYLLEILIKYRTENNKLNELQKFLLPLLLNGQANIMP